VKKKVSMVSFDDHTYLKVSKAYIFFNYFKIFGLLEDKPHLAFANFTAL
jgi:hypothetical protein